MDALTKLADTSVERVSPTRHWLRGAVAGAILYGGFSLELSLLAPAGGVFSLTRLLVQVAFGMLAGAVMGVVFGSVLGRFRHRGLLAHQVAGLAAGAILVVPFALLVEPFLGLNVGTIAGATLAFGISLGTVIWGSAKYRGSAA